jgi:hypothetical protein
MIGHVFDFVMRRRRGWAKQKKWLWFFHENQKSSSLKNEPLSNFYQFYLIGVQPSKMENSLWRHNEIYSLWHHKDEFPILDTKNFQEPPTMLCSIGPVSYVLCAVLVPSDKFLGNSMTFRFSPDVERLKRTAPHVSRVKFRLFFWHTVFGRSTCLSLLPEIADGRRASFWHKTSPPCRNSFRYTAAFSVSLRSLGEESNLWNYIMSDFDSCGERFTEDWVVLEKDAITLTDILAGRGKLWHACMLLL